MQCCSNFQDTVWDLQAFWVLAIAQQNYLIVFSDRCNSIFQLKPGQEDKSNSEIFVAFPEPRISLTFKSISRKIKEGAIANSVSDRPQTGATNTSSLNLIQLIK